MGKGVLVVLEVSVLGSVRASTGGHEHRLSGVRQRYLLARLILSRGRPLTAERLIDELWDGSPPRDPGHALQAHISRLRSAVPVEIALTSGGYSIDPSVVHTDAERFEELLHLGSEAVQNAELSLASEYIRAALDLWRGVAYTDLQDVTVLRAEAVRLENLWAAALADRIDLDLALGHTSAVIPELHSLVEQNPIPERHWGQLMCALYCDGRPQEAVDTFSRARTVFAEHLGSEPSAELCDLHRQILQQLPPESLSRLSSASTKPSTTGGSVNITPRPAVAVQTHRTTAPHAIPFGTRSLTSHDSNSLERLLQHHRTLLLTGPAGIGKTHLLRAFREQVDNTQHTVTQLTASPLSRAIPLGVFTGILAEDRATPAALISHFDLVYPNAILLVDNVGQLDDASLFVLGQLIRTSHILTILTARALSDVPDEICAMYDSGELFEVTISPLTAADADTLVGNKLGAPLTPKTRPEIYGVARGNPLLLREILTASVSDNRLVRTDHGWELQGEPATTSRLSQLGAERFTDLHDNDIEAAARIAIAHDYPSTAVTTAHLHALTRSGVVEYSAPAWLRLSNPLDHDYLRDRCSPAVWHELTREVLNVLGSDAAASSPAAGRRARVLMLDLGEPIDPKATLELAAHALGSFDERLALRAAQAVIQVSPDSFEAHRISGLAASTLGKFDDAISFFEAARTMATTDSEQTAIALAHARHLGLRHHNAPAALATIETALQSVSDPRETLHLQRDAMRWATISGRSPEQANAASTAAETAHAPTDNTGVGSVLNLLTLGVSGVITGPLDAAISALEQLQQSPTGVVDLIPGGTALIELTSIMVLSNSGEVDSSRQRLTDMIEYATTHAPESLGDWEYALAFSELLSGGIEEAYDVAAVAVSHLEWRDATGLLPAALALAGAASQALGYAAEARARFDAIPVAAYGDPKVAMPRAWAQAWQAHVAGNRGDAARHLLDSARWQLEAQHTYFAGMLAHCAVRVSALHNQPVRDRHLAEAVTLLAEAQTIAGGGLLEFFTQHAEATRSGDHAELEALARRAEARGMRTTATGTWLYLAQPGVTSPDRPNPQPQESAARLIADTPSMALWAQSAPNVLAP